MTRAITPTLAVCAAAALITGVALARPGDAPTATTAPAETIYPSDAAGAGDDDRPDTAPAAAVPAPAAIEIVDFAFGGNLTVAVDQPITVSNADSAPHTLTATDGAFDTSVIDAGGSAQITAPATAGTFAIVCTIHPSMTANLTVTT